MITSRKIKAVAFDVFGTLAEITDKRRPYYQLAQTCPVPGEIGRIAMTHYLGLAGLAHDRQSRISLAEMATLESDLYAELASVRLFAEAAQVLTRLRERGLPLAIISNLAAPYAVPIKLLLPFQLEVYAWSFTTGFMKPDAGIYAWTANRLGFASEEILMVGDTWKADYEGASAAGFQALHLDRRGSMPDSDPRVIRDLTGIYAHLDLAL